VAAAAAAVVERRNDICRAGDGDGRRRPSGDFRRRTSLMFDLAAIAIALACFAAVFGLLYVLERV
jgi:hypothetical protein